MAYRFIAYPVSMGDAFFVEDEGFRFLVDGGKQEAEIGNMLVKDSVTALDLVICTHLDGDHLNGIKGLFEKNTVSVNHLWLPGDWILLILYVATRPPESLPYYDNAIKACAAPGSEILNLLAVGPSTEPNVILEENEYGHPLERDDFDLLEGAVRNAHYLSSPGLPYPRSIRYWKTRRVFKGLATASEIVINALRRGCKVTFWRYAGRVTNIPKRDFVCLNATPSSISKYKAVFNSVKHFRNPWLFAALTQINRESLVFRYSPKDKPEVLFTADSGFGFCRPGYVVNLKPNSVITAPHHGSDDNEHANTYNILANNTSSLYVRSDKANSGRPGLLFTGIPNPNRFCTNCSYGHLKQKLEFVSGRNGFVPVNPTPPCPIP